MRRNVHRERVNRKFRMLLLTAGLTILPAILFSQAFLLKGVILDEKSRKPIPEANIRISGSGSGTSTGSDGGFSLNIRGIPVTLQVTCLGYKTGEKVIREVPKGRISITLQPETYLLNEIEINSNRAQDIFKDRTYSVLDYELMDGNPILLIFRSSLKKSELVLLNDHGDTLSVSGVPDVPPSGLYKDFLSNIHLVSKSGNAYQCFYETENRQLEFLPPLRHDSLLKICQNLLFSTGDRIYFEETRAGGMGMTLGYYRKGTGRKVIREYINHGKLREQADDHQFYSRWNQLIASQSSGLQTAAGFAQGPKLGQLMSQYDERAYRFEFFAMTFPVILSGPRSIVFFNFGENVMECMDLEGDLEKTIPLTFHREFPAPGKGLSRGAGMEPGWRWENRILRDEKTSAVYTTFTKFGMVRLNRIDLTTGQLKPGTVLPVAFPEKICIWNGVAWFLYKKPNENKALMKCNL